MDVNCLNNSFGYEKAPRKMGAAIAHNRQQTSANFKRIFDDVKMQPETIFYVRLIATERTLRICKGLGNLSFDKSHRCSVLVCMRLNSLRDFEKKTIMGEYYVNLLYSFNNSVKERRRHLTKQNTFFHHYNALLHTCGIVMAKLYELGF